MNLISYFNAPCYTIVDSGSTIASNEIQARLHALQSQIFPIPVEARGSLFANKRSQKFLQKATERL